MGYLLADIKQTYAFQMKASAKRSVMYGEGNSKKMTKNRKEARKKEGERQEYRIIRIQRKEASYRENYWKKFYYIRKREL